MVLFTAISKRCACCSNSTGNRVSVFYLYICADPLGVECSEVFHGVTHAFGKGGVALAKVSSY